MDQLPNVRGPGVWKPVLKCSVGEGKACGAQLELSTGVVVGFCYHKAADLRVRQAAHSLPCLTCIQSCSAIAVCPSTLVKPFARDYRSAFLTALHGVWSLTGHELLRWERPRCLCGSRAVLFGFSGFVLDQIRALRERFLDWIWTDFTVCAQRTSLPVHPFQRISRVGGGTANPARLVCCNTLKSA